MPDADDNYDISIFICDYVQMTMAFAAKPLRDCPLLEIIKEPERGDVLSPTSLKRFADFVFEETHRLFKRTKAMAIIKPESLIPLAMLTPTAESKGPLPVFTCTESKQVNLVLSIHKGSHVCCCCFCKTNNKKKAQVASAPPTTTTEDYMTSKKNHRSSRIDNSDDENAATANTHLYQAVIPERNLCVVDTSSLYDIATEQRVEIIEATIGNTFCGNNNNGRNHGRRRKTTGSSLSSPTSLIHYTSGRPAVTAAAAAIPAVNVEAITTPAAAATISITTLSAESIAVFQQVRNKYPTITLETIHLPEFAAARKLLFSLCQNRRFWRRKYRPFSIIASSTSKRRS